MDHADRARQTCACVCATANLNKLATAVLHTHFGEVTIQVAAIRTYLAYVHTFDTIVGLFKPEATSVRTCVVCSKRRVFFIERAMDSVT